MLRIKELYSVFTDSLEAIAHPNLNKLLSIRTRLMDAEVKLSKIIEEKKLEVI